MKKTLTLIAATLFACIAKAQEKAYIFTYFDTKKQSAGLCLAYSYDGYRWTPINNNQPIMKPTVGKDKLLRDPSVVQAPDGTFHMVWTSSWHDQIIGYSSSTDLIHWSQQEAIPVMKDFPTARNSWAPELFYDSDKKLYYIYWASTVPGAKKVSTEGCLSEDNYNHRIYCCTTSDFKKFSKTKLWYNPNFNAIDAAVVKDPETGELIMAVKNENLNPPEKNIRIVLGKSMKKGFTARPSLPIHDNFRAEGPAPLFIRDGLIVFYDMYGAHRYGASLSRDHGRTWQDVSDRISMPKGMSHGTAIEVDRSVVDSLVRWDALYGQKEMKFFSFGTPTNPDKVSFLVNDKGIMIGGRYVVPVMGEIHYSRVPRADWQRELRKMKAGGINIISTYVFWNHHEKEQGKWDWTGNKDLRAFLQFCQQENLPVVLRMGPFCHGEVYQGGFPSWIVDSAEVNPKEYKLRSLAPGFMAAANSLYSHIAEQVRGMLWKDGGPVVGVQIENECRGPWAYLMALRETAIKAGFDVPMMTRTGWPKLSDKEEYGKLLPLYGDYADGFWDRSMKDLPGDYAKGFTMKNARLSTVIATETFTSDQLTSGETSGNEVYPYLTCELGGGMMPSYHRRININGKEALPLAVCKLGSGSNLPGYYMYHGGSNPSTLTNNMAEYQASTVTNYNDLPHISYDFQAPLGEMGQPNWNSFHETRWLHQFLADWGEELAPMDVQELSEHSSRRGCFVFHNDYVRIHNESGSASVTPQGMKWKGVEISSSTLQPFAKVDGEIYFIALTDNPRISVNGSDFEIPVGIETIISGIPFTILTKETAQRAYVIDDKMYYSHDGGILYKSDGGIVEETWKYQPESSPLCTVKSKLAVKVGGLRKVKMGAKNAAEQPSAKDWDKAAIYTLNLKLDKKAVADDLFLEINYKGDCAMVTADGALVQDNFWNGKPMLVRARDIVGKNVKIHILPLGKDYPIYLQQQQRAELDASQKYLLSLDSIRVLHRNTTQYQR